MRSRYLIVALFLAATAARGTSAELQLKDGDVLAICGDSITAQMLYSVFVEEYLLMCQPAGKLQAMQSGWPGEASWGFRWRIDQSIKPFKPTVVTICYGMNDGAYRPMSDATGRHYYSTMKAVVAKFKQMGVRTIILGSPGAVDTTFFDHGPKTRPPATVYNQTLGALTELAAKVAQEEGILFADVHTPMMEVMSKAKAKLGPQYPVCGAGTGVHPGPNGHLIMAYAFLKAMGCDGNIGTITMDYANGKAVASDGHKVQSSAVGKVEIQSTRYPFCFMDSTKADDTARSILEFLPFNQDLNRFMLVVKNAPQRARVKWGNEEKTFDAAQLAQGINLAAEFLDNPFCESFQQVQKAISAHQSMEIRMTTTFHGLAQWIKNPETLKQAVDECVQHDEALRATAAAAVKPVIHTIVVTPAEGGK